MTKRSFSALFCVLFYLLFFSQKMLSQKKQDLTITIIDKTTHKVLPNAHVSIGRKHAYTNLNGNAIFHQIFNQISEEISEEKSPKKLLKITHVGYVNYQKTVDFSKKHTILLIALTQDNAILNEVTITQKPVKNFIKYSGNKQKINTEFLAQNRDNSLMQTLQNIPGVSAITIGSGQSKPTIRGLGFNRVVVVENGIKHEAQQWGADHGLEIDQYNVESIEITKGAASLMYGSDAIAGVINIKNNTLPNVNSLAGEVNITHKNNNNLYGISFGVKQRYKHWYYKTRITHQQYGDYKVPVRKITYDNYIFDLHQNNLRNTAGKNHNIGFSLGYTDDALNSTTYISNVHAKNGFFANAHGLEVRTSKIDYDKSSNDIDLPLHKVNHFKINNNTRFSLKNNTLDIEIGFQKNDREEHSEPIAHGYMSKPTSTMERRFTKNTYNFNIKNENYYFDNYKIVTGINLDYQHNKIAGWGFLIPEYTRFTVGAFVYNQLKINKNIHIDAGIRYDYGNLKTQAYYESFVSPVNKNGIISMQKLQRATKNNLHFDNFSASAGISYSLKNTLYKINIGKSFRIPLANELASNGVNYHMYRYEQGKIDLKPESSYQIDAEFKADFSEFNNFKKASIQLTPFANYFDNYIYLTPTSGYYETLQKYKYTQNKVFRYGGEITLEYTPIKKIAFTASLEYVKSRQLNGEKKNFSLPFSPPLTGVFSFEYTFNDWVFFEKTKFFSNLRSTVNQHDIVPPEKPTNGATVINAGLHTNISVFSKKNPMKIQGKLNNIFNKTVFNHTSFYRLIEVPEPNRNFSISIIQTF